MILKSNIDSGSFIEYTRDSVVIASGPMSITTDAVGGNFVNGPISFSSSFASMRFGGIFKFNPLQAFGIPSTMVTPINTFNIEIPVKEAAALLAVSAMVLSAV
jgi:hypothetical protein